MSNETKTIFSEREKVRFKNLRPWDIGFDAVCNHDSILIEGNTTMTRLSIQEIYEQVQRGNPAFCGVDGYGKHAPFRILDEEKYRYIFDTDSGLPEQMNEELIEELLKIRDRKKFEKRLDEVVLTRGDERHLAYVVGNRNDLDDFPGWMIKMIEKKTGHRFDS